MKLRQTLMMALAMPVLAGGCATTGGGGDYRSDEIAREEIASVQGATNLYDVVQRLRPRWLTAERRAGERSFGLQTGVVVFQDQNFLGDIDVLRRLAPGAADRLEWMDGATASASLPGLGASHVAGAIIVHTFAPT